MLPKTVLMMFSGAIWWWEVFMYPQTWILVTLNSRSQQRICDRFCADHHLRVLCRHLCCRCVQKLYKSWFIWTMNNECRSNILAPLFFSLPSIQFEKKATIIYILSFPRPFVRLGKVCQVWIWLHYCFLWLFRQWKVSKKLVYCRLVLSQCLTKLVGSSYLYTLI